MCGASCSHSRISLHFTATQRSHRRRRRSSPRTVTIPGSLAFVCVYLVCCVLCVLCGVCACVRVCVCACVRVCMCALDMCVMFTVTYIKEVRLQLERFIEAQEALYDQSLGRWKSGGCFV